jgi:hypothetical protein
MTMRPSAAAQPIVVTGLVAERTAIGPYLQEVMRPAPDSNVKDFRRIDYLTYNTLQARWQYLSMDTRATVGLMYAQGLDDDSEDTITVYFSDAPGPTELGPALDGRFMRARHVLTRESEDREVVRQYWTFSGAPEWLAVEYRYLRKSVAP